MKRHETARCVSPGSQAAAGGERRRFVRVLRRVSDVLNRRQLFDAEGRFWTARTLLRDGQRRPFERLRLVVVDGFADFTATQHDILEILAEHADELIVSLPLERDVERRRDLFAKPLATLEQLSRRLPGARVEWMERRAMPHGRR
jgi:hypothetical protein